MLLRTFHILVVTLDEVLNSQLEIHLNSQIQLSPRKTLPIGERGGVDDWAWSTKTWTNQGSREPSVLMLSRDALCKIRHQEADGEHHRTFVTHS